MYAAGVLLVVGGLCVLLGVFTRIAAAGLAVFMVVAALIFHDFWRFTGMEAEAQRIQFLKNISLMGGALLVVFFGPGPYSVRARSRVLERRRERRGRPPGAMHPQHQG